MTDIEVLYFDLNHAIAVHDFVIEYSGGKEGINRIDLLDSALVNVKNDLYYKNFIEKITHLIFATIKFHAFIDGNKRTALMLGAYFLELNGYGYCIKRYIFKMENIVVWVAENKISKDLLAEIVFSIISEEDYSEEIKLKIIHATA